MYKETGNFPLKKKLKRRVLNSYVITNRLHGRIGLHRKWNELKRFLPTNGKNNIDKIFMENRKKGTYIYNQKESDS